MRDKVVAILEARASEQVADLIKKYGGIPLCAPAISEQPDLDLPLMKTLFQKWSNHPPRIFVFQTGVGTKALFKAAESLGITGSLLELLKNCTVVARGPKPTAALRTYGVRIDIPINEPYTTKEILIALQDMPIENEQVVIQRYGQTNVELDKALEERGAIVTEIPTYRWALPEDTSLLTKLMDELAQHKVDAVAFTSGAQIHNLFKLASGQGRAESLKQDLNRTLIASIGPVCSRTLRDFGINVKIEASPPKLGPFLSALKDALSTS